MVATHRSGIAIIDAERDTLERLGEDDLAAVRAGEFQQVAMLEHEIRARLPGSVPGVCTNCGEVCLPAAVFCDGDCREDHEKRERTSRRTGATA